MIGIFISIGPIIDEVQEYKYVNNRNCAKARQLLLITWLFVAFNITLSYKEVLIANLINVEYEDTIDNLDDLVRSGMPICLPENGLLTQLVLNDPRDSAKQLLDKIVYYKFTIPFGFPAWIKNG